MSNLTKKINGKKYRWVASVPNSKKTAQQICKNIKKRGCKSCKIIKESLPIEYRKYGSKYVYSIYQLATCKIPKRLY